MVERVQTNNNSITSLTIGILSILLPLIGLVLGIIGIVFSRKALKEIGETHENGRGLAITGLVCSVVGIVTQLFGLFSLLLFFNLTTTSF